jgi:hypothetical protein
VLGPVTDHAPTKRSQRQVAHELSEHEFASVHGRSWRKTAKPVQAQNRSSNRDQTKFANLPNESST